MGFNDKQIAARDSKVNKIIVSAGAGTGKTTVLAERVKKLLIEDCYKDNTNITNFLILTFTKAAASSMKKKFKKAINEALTNETDKDKISFLKKQLIYINNADISTIDSFCEKIVKENSSLCGIKSDFDILSEIELSFIEDDILDDLIEEENINNNELLTKLRIYTNSVKSNFDKAMKKTIKEIYNKTSQIPYKIASDSNQNITNIYNAISNSIGLTEDINDSDNFNTGKLYNFYLEANKVMKEELKKELDMNNNDFVKRFNDLKDNFEDLVNQKINEAKSLSGEELAIANLKIAKSKELLAKDDKGKNFFDTNDLFAKNKFVDRFVEMNKALETDDYSLIMDALSKKIPTTDKYKGSYFEDKYENLREDIKVYLSCFDFVDERVIKDATLRDSKNNIIPLMSKNTDLVNYVFNLVAKYQDMILREKMRINKFGFNDIELFAYNILVESKTKEMVNEKIDDEEYNFTYNNITKTEVAKMLSNKYKYIMVDEYQDTNELQDDLMESLYTNTESYHNNLFLVGDIKQSIYKFRGADVGVFINKCNRYRYESAKHNNEYEYLQLTINYRCQPKIIDAVNDLFKNIVMKDVSGYAYEALDKGKQENDDQKYPVVYNTPILLDNPNDEEESNSRYDDGQSNININQFKSQVFVLVSEIERIKKEKEAKGEEFKYSDVAILCRKMNKFETVLCRILEDYGIPYKVSRKGFLASKEVSLLINYLNILHYEFNDVILAEVLVSPLYNFSVNEIFSMSNLNSNSLRSKLYEYLLTHIDEQKIDEFNNEFFNNSTYDIKKYLNDNTKKMTKEEMILLQKVERFLRHYNHLTVFKKSHNIEELLKEMVRITNYETYTLVKQKDISGELRNVYDLYNFAHNVESKRQIDIGEFIEKIDTLNKSIFKQDENNDYISYGDNSVIIESIHGSKGLEYDTVFVITLETRMVINNDMFMFDPRYGLCYDLFDFKNLFYYEPEAYKRMKEVLMIDDLNEEIRLLYVAMTRAKENLILFNVEQKLTKIKPYGKHNIPIFNIRCVGNLLEAMRHDTHDCYLDDDMKEIKTLKFVRLEDTYVASLQKGLEKRQRLFVKDIKALLKIEETIEEENLPILTKEINDNTNSNANNDNKIKVPLRMSVSDIKKDHIEKSGKKFYTKVSRDLTEDQMTGAEKGTIYHFLAKSIDKDTDVEVLLKTKLNNNEITEREYNTLVKDLAIEKFEKYKHSEVMDDLTNAKKIYREYPFTMKMLAKDVYKDGLTKEQETQEIIIEGIVDLMYIKPNGKIQIVDYKTDKIRGNREKAIKAAYDNYQIQLDLYKHAMANALGKDEEKDFETPILYFFNDLDGIDEDLVHVLVKGEKETHIKEGIKKLPKEKLDKAKNDTKAQVNVVKIQIDKTNEELKDAQSKIKTIKNKVNELEITKVAKVAKASNSKGNIKKGAKDKLKYVDENIYYMKTGTNKYAYCKVDLDNNEAVILKDSHIDFKHTDASLTNGNSKRRNELNGLSERNITKEDYKVDSPSTAACIVAGGARNGNREWKRTTDGIKLGDVRKN